MFNIFNITEVIFLLLYGVCLLFSTVVIKKFKPENNKYTKLSTFTKLKKNTIQEETDKRTCYFYPFEFYLFMLFSSIAFMIGFIIFVINYDMDFKNIPITFMCITTYLYALIAIILSIFSKARYTIISEDKLIVNQLFKKKEILLANIDAFKYDNNKIQLFINSKMVYETIENDAVILYNICKNNLCTIKGEK